MFKNFKNKKKSFYKHYRYLEFSMYGVIIFWVFIIGLFFTKYRLHWIDDKGFWMQIFNIFTSEVFITLILSFTGWFILQIVTKKNEDEDDANEILKVIWSAQNNIRYNVPILKRVIRYRLDFHQTHYKDDFLKMNNNKDYEQIKKLNVFHCKNDRFRVTEDISNDCKLLFGKVSFDAQKDFIYSCLDVYWVTKPQDYVKVITALINKSELYLSNSEKTTLITLINVINFQQEIYKLLDEYANLILRNTKVKEEVESQKRPKLNEFRIPDEDSIFNLEFIPEEIQEDKEKVRKVLNSLDLEVVCTHKKTC